MPFPTRREFLASAAAVGAARAQTPRRRPNLLYIFSDQHRACSMPGAPFNDVQAPNLARLASEGMTFDRCISNYPVCSPYRGILLSGRWPFQTGVVDNSYPLKLDETSLGETFRRAGYRTGYVGKWHLDTRGGEGGGLKPEGNQRHGFQEWRAWYNTNTHFDKSFTYDLMTGQRLQPQGYNATLMTEDTLGFIDRNDSTKTGRPWMLVVSWNPPHPPFDDAPPELMKQYEPGGLQLRPNAVEEITNAVGGGRNRPVRPDLSGYNAHITAIDKEIGRILKKLDETGQADNTIVVYSSDHGEMLGAQNRMGKRLPHDESCRVPFLVRSPGAVPSGQKTGAVLSTIDIYPTLCGLAGLEAPSHCEGVDLSAIARGQQSYSPEHAFLMHIDKHNASGGSNHPAPIFRGIRSARYTYAVGEIGRWCLYDDQEDPYQQSNLADDPARQSLMSDLDGEILHYLGHAKDSYPFHTVRAKRSITTGKCDV